MNGLRNQELQKQQSPHEAGFVGHCLDSVDFWKLMSGAETGIVSKQKPLNLLTINLQTELIISKFILGPFEAPLSTFTRYDP